MVFPDRGIDRRAPDWERWTPVNRRAERLGIQLMVYWLAIGNGLVSELVLRLEDQHTIGPRFNQMADIIGVTITQDSVQVVPGESFAIGITVRNDSNVVDVIYIAVEGLDPSWYR